MGLERIAAVCQGKRSNFDCDLFQEIIQFAAQRAGVTYSASAPDSNEVDTALRVIADHSRAAAFLIAEGVLPSNEGRGYVLRRLIRRALRFATLMGVEEPFLHAVARKVTELMGDAYPELVRHADFIARAVHEEERRFAQTLSNGLRLLDEELARLEQKQEKVISGEFCFRLSDTYGFPLDIVNDVAEKRGFAVDAEGFAALMRQQRERARANQKAEGLFGHGSENEIAASLKSLGGHLETSFVGYESLTAESPILALLDAGGAPTPAVGEGGSGFLVARLTPFYAESGGQTADAGSISTATGEARVQGVLKAGACIVQLITVLRGEIHADQEARLNVDADQRAATARNHTCTHLLHAALRRVLGEHVKQSGSLVDATRLRFDFSHLSALTPEELAAVERDVNRVIMADLPVLAREMPREEALAAGAMALFSEKYGDVVRVLSVGKEDEAPESVELCGGTHLERTGQAGLFLIVSESGVAAGVRRIEAGTGWNAYGLAISQRAELGALAFALKAGPGQAAERLQTMQEELKKLRRAVEKGASASVDGAELARSAESVDGVKLVARKLDNVPLKALRELMDDLRSRLPGPAVACLAGVADGKANLLLYVSKDLHGRFTAPALIREAAAAGGGSGGGGRPDQAQAGGVRQEAVDEAFAVLRRQIGGAQ